MRILRWFLGIAAALVALVAGVYFVVLAINWNDQPLSAEAPALGATFEDRLPVADRDNAYVYLLGLGAPPGADPWAIGLERAARARELTADASLNREPDPYLLDLSIEQRSSEAMRALLRSCDERRDAECFAALQADAAAIGAWLADEGLWLERYRTLIAIESWREIRVLGFQGAAQPGAAFSRVRSLLFVEAWRRASDNDADGVRDLLDADLRFWRRVLAASDTFLMKLVAARAVVTHFEWGNLILKRLAQERIVVALPESWAVPFSRDELSMRLVFGGEWLYLRNLIEGLHSHGSYGPAGATDTSTPAGFEHALLVKPFLQPNASLNKRAAEFLALESLLEGPFAELPQALKSSRELASAGSATDEGLYDLAYNWIGDLLLYTDDVYTQSVARVADVEGVRRAALAAAQLRIGRADPEQVPRELAAHPLRNPYTDAPFPWDGDAGAIVFAGLEHAPRGAHAFWY